MVSIFIFAVPKYTVVTFRSQNASLSLAAIYGHVEVCKFLFAANADLSLRSRLRTYVTHSIALAHLIALTVIAEVARLLFNLPSKMESLVLLIICAAFRRRCELLALHCCGNFLVDSVKCITPFSFQ
jgi:hypothetical protein